jgi:flagellar biosynthesis protein FlhF
MKIKRFFATDMRQAIRQVRETLGSDAVILSNKAVDGGVELVAAIDYDESAVMAAAQVNTVVKAKPVKRREASDEVVTTFARKGDERPRVATEPAPMAPPAAVEEMEARPQRPTQRVEWSQEPVLVEMRREMQALRRMMENELSELTWRDMGARRPQSQELLRRLMGLGLSPDICRSLVTQVQDIGDEEKAWRKALYGLASSLPVGGDQLLEQGGVVAIIGPTGVGKTTTVAKLAARFCLRHGNRHVALITTDNFRIGAREQLNTYARILDVPVRSAGNVEELNAALNAFCDRRLILVDTAGMSQRDVRLSEQLSMLSAGNQRVRSLLALPATTQQADLERAMKAFAAARPDGVVLTKVDEAASLGGAFSAIIHSGLPLAYITDGQKVPEDLHLAHANTLVGQAESLFSEGGSEQDDEFMALALGGVRANAHV